MTEQQWGRLLWTTVFNLPIILFGLYYLRLCVRSYRHYRDGRSIRGVTIAAGFVAALIGGWARGLGDIVSGAPAAPAAFRVIVFACLVISLAAIVSILRSWYRERG